MTSETKHHVNLKLAIVKKKQLHLENFKSSNPAQYEFLTQSKEPFVKSLYHFVERYGNLSNKQMLVLDRMMAQK